MAPRCGVDAQRTLCRRRLAEPRAPRLPALTRAPSPCSPCPGVPFLLQVGRDKNDKPTRVRNDQPSRSGPWD